MSNGRSACLVSSLLLTVAGCGNGIPFDESSTVVAGFGDGCVYYQHSKRYTGSGILPSSMWRLDLESLQARRVQEATPQDGLQVEGDYYVTELIRDGQTRGKVVVVQMSSGRRTTLYERESYSGQPIVHGLSGERAIVLADGELRIFDVVGEEPLKTINVAADSTAIVAFRGDRVVLLRVDQFGSERAVLVDIVNEEQFEIPPAPGNSQPFYIDAHLASSGLVVSRVEEVGDGRARSDVLLFDVEAATWEILAQAEAFDSYQFFPVMVVVFGYTGESVVVAESEFEGLDLAWTINNIDVNTGDQSVIASGTQSFLDVDVPRPRLNDGRLYWVDPSLPLLVVHELATGREEFFSLRLPD